MNGHTEELKRNHVVKEYYMWAAVRLVGLELFTEDLKKSQLIYWLGVYIRFGTGPWHFYDKYLGLINMAVIGRNLAFGI